MHPTILTLVLFLFLAILTKASGPTKLFIDSVPEYDILEQCAENQVSSIIRNMNFGCGDGSQTTSYACFCYQSSAKFSRMVSTRVSSACTKSPGQDSSAVEVFSKYCELGEVEKVTTGTSVLMEPTASASIQNMPASPASATLTVTISATASSSPSEPQQKSKDSAAIIAGVIVPTSIIALAMVGFLIFLRRRDLQSTPKDIPTEDPARVMSRDILPEKDIYEGYYEVDATRLHEMDGFGEQRSELAGAKLEYRAEGKADHLVREGALS